jgi:hypothetical protein
VEDGAEFGHEDGLDIRENPLLALTRALSEKKGRTALWVV